MNANEIVPHDKNRDGGLEMRQLLTESVCQAREAAKLHPNGQITALHVARANVRLVRVAADLGWDRLDNFARAIPLRAGIFGRLPVNLDELSKVNVRPEVGFDSVNVTSESIGCDLMASDHARVVISNKRVGAFGVTLPDVVGDQQFGLSVDSRPGVGVTPLGRVASVEVPFLGVDKTPNLIKLREARANVADAKIEKRSALLSHGEKQRHDGVEVCVGKACDGAKADAFNHHGNNLSGLFDADGVGAKGLRLALAESGLAVKAAVSLNPSLPVASELLGSGALTFGTVHFGLPFPQSKPIMGLRSAFAADSAIADWLWRELPTLARAFSYSSSIQRALAVCQGENWLDGRTQSDVQSISWSICGDGGSRTHGSAFTCDGVPTRNRPLCHVSASAGSDQPDRSPNTHRSAPQGRLTLPQGVKSTLGRYWLKRDFDSSVTQDSDSHPIPPGDGQAKVHRAPPFTLRNDLEAKEASFGFHFRSKPVYSIHQRNVSKGWVNYG